MAKDKYHMLAANLHLGMDKVQHTLIRKVTFVDSKVKQAVFMGSEIAFLRLLNYYMIIYAIVQLSE